VIVVDTAPSPHLPGPLCSPAEPRSWLTSDGCAAPVLDVLDAHGWHRRDDGDSNIHATSPDGAVSLAWLPEDSVAWKNGVLWRIDIRVPGASWTQTFGQDIPAKAVAGFLTTLIAVPEHAC
jgi:hypothetical protein